MSTVLGERQGALPRPYTQGTFQQRLLDFEALIRDLTLQDVEATPDERRQMITEHLRFDQFCDSIKALFGGDVRNQDLKAIYRKISTNPDAKVDWSELFGYFQSENESEDVTVGEEVSVFTVSARQRVGDAAGDRKRRDIVVAMKYIPALDCYMSGSQKGAVSMWSNKLRFQGCTDINEAAWLTGLDFLPTIRRMAGCTERSICIWDNRAKGKNQQVFTIKPIENSPQCMTWVPYTKSVHEDALLFGDDQGYVNLLVVAAKDLNMKNSRGDKRITTSYVLDPEKLSYPIKKKRLHDDWVLKIKYFPELRCFGSCSPSNTSSFVLDEVEKVFPDESRIPAKEDKYSKRKKKKEAEEPKGVGVPKGVNAFEYCARANIIATGGVDKVIRVWHPHIWSRPTGKLLGHLFTIVDICCNEKDQHIISLSTARVIRVWDIHTLTSLQVFTDNEERPGEKRIYCTLFDNKHERLLTGSSVVDAWPLTRAVQDTMQVPHTHDRPLTQVIFNKELNQIISVCSESVIKVWEAETGKAVYQIPDAHGPNIEVTCVSLDKSGYRLASGGLDGSIKIWDFGSGQEIKRKVGKGTDETDLSILGLQYCEINSVRCLICLGWNNKLKIIEDAENPDLPIRRDFIDVVYLSKEVSMSVSPTQDDIFNKKTPLPDITPRGSAQVTSIFRKDNVLMSYELTCLTTLLPDLLVAGTSSGNLILWDIQKATVDKVIPLPDTTRVSESESKTPRASPQKDQVQHGVTTAKFVVHKVRKLDPAFIKSLTKHISDDEFSDEDESHRGSKRRSKRHSRASRYSRSTSRASSISFMPAAPANLERNLIDELTAKIEGVDAVKKAPEPKSEEKPAEEKTETVPAAEVGKHVEITIKVEGETEANAADEVQPNMEEKKEAVDPDDIDPESKMIVEKFDPVLVTCHMDSFIRFWTPQGKLLREITAMTRRQGSSVTAMTHDEDVNILVTADHKGYITMWDVGEFLEDPESENKDLIKQIICWRGHLSKVVELTYVDSIKSVISGSTDGSVRVWWGFKGRFIGFFGQHRGFNFPASEESSSTPVLPYDINEGPLAPVKSFSARQKMKKQKFEYPLIFDKERWEPFRRSAYMRQRTVKMEPEDKKFFAALIKPRADNKELESFTTGEMTTGAVFRALPVYRGSVYSEVYNNQQPEHSYVALRSATSYSDDQHYNSFKKMLYNRDMEKYAYANYYSSSWQPFYQPTRPMSFSYPTIVPQHRGYSAGYPPTTCCNIYQAHRGGYTNNNSYVEPHLDPIEIPTIGYGSCERNIYEERSPQIINNSAGNYISAESAPSSSFTQSKLPICFKSPERVRMDYENEVYKLVNETIIENSTFVSSNINTNNALNVKRPNECLKRPITVDMASVPQNVLDDGDEDLSIAVACKVTKFNPTQNTSQNITSQKALVRLLTVKNKDLFNLARSVHRCKCKHDVDQLECNYNMQKQNIIIWFRNQDKIIESNSDISCESKVELKLTSEQNFLHLTENLVRKFDKILATQIKKKCLCKSAHKSFPLESLPEELSQPTVPGLLQSTRLSSHSQYFINAGNSMKTDETCFPHQVVPNNVNPHKRRKQILEPRIDRQNVPGSSNEQHNEQNNDNSESSYNQSQISTCSSTLDRIKFILKKYIDNKEELSRRNLTELSEKSNIPLKTLKQLYFSQLIDANVGKNQTCL